MAPTAVSSNLDTTDLRVHKKKKTRQPSLAKMSTAYLWAHPHMANERSPPPRMVNRGPASDTSEILESIRKYRDDLVSMADIWRKQTIAKNGCPFAVRCKDQLREAASQPVDDLLATVHETLPFTQATEILDLGCGTGATTSRLIDNYEQFIPAETKIRAIDASPAILSEVDKIKWQRPGIPLWQNLEISLCNPLELTAVPTGTYSHVLSAFTLAALSDTRTALQEVHRILDPGHGAIGILSWLTSDWFDLMYYVHQVRPDLPHLRVAEEWSSPRTVKHELEAAGFTDVTAHTTRSTMTVKDPEKYVEGFVLNMPPLLRSLELLSPAHREEAKQLMITHLRKKYTSWPAELEGVAILAVGRT